LDSIDHREMSNHYRHEGDLNSDNEDSQEHQHHVHEGRGVDIRHRRFAAAARRNGHVLRPISKLVSVRGAGGPHAARARPVSFHQAFEAVAGAGFLAAAAAWGEAVVTTAGFTAPREVMLARMSVEKP